MKIKLSDITILPDRQRPVFDDDYISELSESMRLIGLIHPIVVDEQGLVAGECRIRAARLLGWTEIDATLRSDLSPWEREFIELEENIRRQDLPYGADVIGKKRIHKLLQEEHGATHPLGISIRGRKSNWRVADTALHLGISVGATSQDIQLADAIEKNPELGKLKSKVAATNALKRQHQLNMHLIMSALDHQKRGGVVKTKGTKIKDEKRGNITLIYADAREYVKTITDLSIGCLLTDPPWGVLFDSEYGLDEKEGLPLMTEVLQLLYPKLTIGSLCWMFCATKHLITGAIYRILLNAGYRVYPQLVLWCKPTIAHASHPYREIKGDYEPIIVFSKGEGRDFLEPIFSLQEFIVEKPKLHVAQKPVALLEKLINISTNEYDLIIDPFCGSGRTLKAARNCGRDSLGIEIEEESYKIAKIDLGV